MSASAHGQQEIPAAEAGARPPTVLFETDVEQEPLPPTDTGRAAWLVLAACSLMQAPVWGFSLAFGVIQEYYESSASGFGGNKASATVIGTSITGILYLCSPLFFALLTRWRHLRRFCGPVGLAITLAGFLLSSFASQMWQLIATQGVLCGFGSGMMFAPSTLYLDEWFVRRKGLAYGIMWSAKSATGVALPFAAAASLERFGYRATMQAWTVAMLLLTAPLLLVLRPRIPVSASSTRARRIDTGFLKQPAFWTLQTGNILQSLGYFLPSAYLPSYSTTQLGLPRRVGTLLLALLNTTSVFGSIVIGPLNDRMRVTRVLLLTTLPSAAAVLLLWGMAGYGHDGVDEARATAATALPLMVVFAAVYGFFAGSFSATWSGVVKELQRQGSPALDTGLVFGLLAGGRGVGNVVSGPLSVALMATSSPARSRGGGLGWAYGGEYGPMIVFTGASALLGSWGWLCEWRWRPWFV